MGFSDISKASRYNLINKRARRKKTQYLKISVNQSNDTSLLREAVTQESVTDNLPDPEEVIPAHIAAIYNEKERTQTAVINRDIDPAMAAQYGWELHWAAKTMNNTLAQEIIKDE